MTTETISAPRVSVRSGAGYVPRWQRALLYLTLIAFAVAFLIPVYLLIVTSMKSFAEVNLYSMWDPPSDVAFHSFYRAWFGSRQGGFRGLGVNFMNSVYLTIPATILSALLGSINGYILAKWKFRGSDVLFTLLLFGMFIPYQSVLIFVHIVYGIPITTLIFRNYYAAVPTELVEASRIDGANIFGVYRHILFPLSIPGFVVVMIWQFTSIWNDFLFAVTVTSSPDVQPITVGLNNLAGSYIVEWNVQMAGALMTALPTLAVYIFLGRFFMRGLLAGSLKG